MFSILSGDFQLDVVGGEFTDSEIIVMLGENGKWCLLLNTVIAFNNHCVLIGTGKTTFIRMLAGLLKPDSGGEIPQMNVSYKPQKISPKFKGTVQQLLHTKIRDSYVHPQFMTDVMKPLKLEHIMDQEVRLGFQTD